MDEREKAQAVPEDNVTLPEKDLEEATGAGHIIIDRAAPPAPGDPPIIVGGGG